MVIPLLIALVCMAAMVWRVRRPLKGFLPRLLQKIISLFALVTFVGVIGWFVMVDMPGNSFRGKPSAAGTEFEERLARLKSDVVHFSTELGERNVSFNPQQLFDAADFIEDRFGELGYVPQRQEFMTVDVPCANIEVEIAGSKLPDEIVVIGAHYDSTIGTPGANDNASGTAALLELAKHCANWKPDRTLRFVAFTNEEPPHFQTDSMGSLVYAKRCQKQGDNIVCAISLETIGFFSDVKGSQQYPPPFGLVYPSAGDFIGVIGDIRSRGCVRKIVSAFRSSAEVPSEGGALPGIIPGVGWSDHWSFWQCGYRGVMITDTAPYRYEHYHQPSDTPDKLDFERMTRVVEALPNVLEKLVDN